MDIGPLLALISAVVFGAGIVLVRKSAGEAGEAFSVTAFSIFAGIPLFAVIISISGEWQNLAGISVKALVMLMAAGFIHFIIGRQVAYEAFRLIGANRATPITQICLIITVILSWVFLDEQPTFFIGLGALCMIAGVFLITREKGSSNWENNKRPPHEVKGIIFSLIAALCWGITPILIKPSVEQVGSSVVGNFITYSTAAIVLVLLLLTGSNRRLNFKRLSFKKNVLPMVIAGLLTSTGQLLFFNALGRSPASVVSPLVSTEILFIFLFSFFINRRTELFTLKVGLGMAAVVAGTFLLFQ